MSEISREKLLKFYDDLKYYDVDQRGWEQEPNGAVVNSMHVLLHIMKDVNSKDFSDETKVKEAIAPDALQYAMRFLRWSGSGVAEGSSQFNITEVEGETKKNLGKLPVGMYEWIEAGTLLAQNLHDIDHQDKRVEAETQLNQTLVSASALLGQSAITMSVHYKFDLEQAFYDRLYDLREHFGIPHPE
ncbi:hypothetical protein H6801_03185 [Candidatus Nomurabacteria bacterium]|nr:hypothetical protein [Candidatus Nomurabacteria bacterium]